MIVLSTLQERPFWKMENHEKLEACERKKHDGNMLFKAGKFWHASKKYEKEIYLEWVIFLTRGS